MAGGPETLEAVNNDEYVFGTHNREIVSLGQLVILNQVRHSAIADPNGPPPQFDFVLFDDIRRNGLENEPTIATMEERPFQDYLAFSDGIWEGDKRDEDFEPDEDGFHRVVICGHRRVENVKAIAMFVDGLIGLTGGYSNLKNDAKIMVKTRVNPSSQEILSLQIGENTYKSPPPERVAMAVVNTYNYGLAMGMWQSAAEFSRLSEGNFSARMIRDAILFKSLPDKIRKMVFTGSIPYSIGVELGRTQPSYVERTLFKYFGDRSLEELSKRERAQVEKDTAEWLGLEVALIEDRKKLNIGAIKLRLKSFRENWRREIDRGRADEGAPSLGFDDGDWNDPVKEWKLHRRRLRDEYRTVIDRLEGRKSIELERRLQLHRELFESTS